MKVPILFSQHAHRTLTGQKLYFKRVLPLFSRPYLDKRCIDKSAEEEILNFLGWSDSLEEKFPKDVRIVLAAANFSKELTTSVMWLNKRDE